MTSRSKSTWLPMLAIEAATASTHGNDPIVMNNLPVRLTERNGKFYGWFEKT